MTTHATTKWGIQGSLQTPADCALFVRAAIEEAGNDPAIITQALSTVARERGMSQVARDAGISREGLYKALAAEGNPSFATVLKVLDALGLKMAIEVAA